MRTTTFAYGAWTMFIIMFAFQNVVLSTREYGCFFCGALIGITVAYQCEMWYINKKFKDQMLETKRRVELYSDSSDSVSESNSVDTDVKYVYPGQ